MNWLWFGFGIAASFFISFLAMVGWWFLVIGRHNPDAIAKAQRDFDEVRASIRRANEHAQRN